MNFIVNVFELTKYSVQHFFREVRELVTEKTMYLELVKK